MKTKRATSDIPIIANEKSDLPGLIENLEKIIKTTTWDYKSGLKRVLILRDQGLVSLLVLSGLRVSEALDLTLSQVHEYPKNFLLSHVTTLKNGLIREKIIIPRDGALGKLCKYFGEWYFFISEQKKAKWLFPSASGLGINFNNKLSRYRVHKIIKANNDLFPHWFRAVYENIYGHIIFNNNPYKLKECMGLKRLESTVPYIQADYEKDISKIYLL